MVRHFVTLSLCAWLSSSLAAAPRADTETQPLAITVQIEGQLNVSAATLFGARTGIARIYRDAGVELHWVASEAELVIVLCSDRDICGRAAAPNTIGQAVIDSSSQVGRVAYIYHDRVEELVHQSHLERGDILGHVMAHEVAHLLGLSHAERGLMRAGWDVTELSLASCGLLGFSKSEREIVRGRVAARATQ